MALVGLRLLKADRIGAAFLVVAVGYLALHGIAAVLGIPPEAFFRAIVQAAGFAFGCAVFLGLALQLLRR